MKKFIYTLTVGLCFSISTYAQVTINQADFATAGDTLFYGYDTTSGPSTLSTSGGANKIWNFSNVENMFFSESVFAPLEFSPVDVPANVTHLLIEKFDGEDEEYSFMNVTANGVELIQSGGGFLGAGDDVRIKTLSFPLTYNSRTSDSTVIVQVIPASFLGSEISAIADSIRITVKVKITNLCDGYGKLTTPTATYDNTLRLKVTTAVNIKLESKKNPLNFWIPLPADLLPIPGNQTDVSYIWIDKTSKYFLAEATMETDNPATMIEFNYQIPRPTSSGLLATAKNQFEVVSFPNPANQLVNIAFNATQKGNTIITIYDITGRLVIEQQEMVSAGKQHITLNTSSLKNGMYTLQVNQNGKVAQQKIVINK